MEEKLNNSVHIKIKPGLTFDLDFFDQDGQVVDSLCRAATRLMNQNLRVMSLCRLMTSRGSLDEDFRSEVLEEVRSNIFRDSQRMLLVEFPGVLLETDFHFSDLVVSVRSASFSSDGSMQFSGVALYNDQELPGSTEIKVTEGAIVSIKIKFEEG